MHHKNLTTSCKVREYLNRISFCTFCSVDFYFKFNFWLLYCILCGVLVKINNLRLYDWHGELFSKLKCYKKLNDYHSESPCYQQLSWQFWVFATIFCKTNFEGLILNQNIKEMINQHQLLMMTILSKNLEWAKKYFKVERASIKSMCMKF